VVSKDVSYITWYWRIMLTYSGKAVIGIIYIIYYNITRGTGTTTFWTEGYRTPTFQDEKVENLQSPAVNRGDLRRLN